MASTVSTAVLGLAFWAVAARTYPAATVGAASAAVSAATLVATAAQLNLTAVFTRFVPVAGAHVRRFVTRGYLVTVLLAAFGSAAFAWSGAGDRYLGTSPAARAAFVLLAVLLLLSAVQDAVLVGLRRAGTVLVENLLFALAKVVLLAAFAAFTVRDGVVLAWLAPLVVAIVAISGGLFGIWLPRHARIAPPATETMPHGRRLASFVAAEYVKSLVTILAPTVIPLVVVAQLGTRQNAYLAVPWMVNAAVVSLFYNVSAAVVVDVAHGEPLHAGPVRRLLVLVGAVTGVGLLVGAGMPGPVLGLLGPGYAEHGAASFRLLSLALPFEAVTAVYGTFAWLERRLWRLTALQTLNAVLLLGGTAVLLPRYGLTGVGWAYLLASVVLGGGSILPAWRRLEVADPAGGDAAVDAPRRAVPGDDGARGDDAVLADGHPGQDDRASADPHVVAQRDRLRVADRAPAAVGVDVMTAGDDQHLHPQRALPADADRCHGLQVAVRVDEAGMTDEDVCGVALDDAAVHDRGGFHVHPGQPIDDVPQYAWGEDAPGDARDQQIPHAPTHVVGGLPGNPRRPGDDMLTSSHGQHGDGFSRSGQRTTLESAEPTRARLAADPPTARRSGALLAGAGAASLVALALWWLALPGVDLTRMDGRGLLACLPPLWYLALLLALAGPCLLVGLGGVGRRTRSMMMLLGLGALITVLYGTTSALYAVPRQYATYKHIAVVEYLLAGYPLDRSVDIYQNWPGFFLAAAELHRLTGVPVLTLARWSEPCFAAVVALAVMWAVGGAFRASGRDGDARADHAHRVRWGAALVVTTANWVGQNYFSPQAVAFPLALAVIGMLLRMVPTPIGPHLRFTVADRRLRRTTWSDQADVHPFWGGPAGAALCLMAYAAIVVTHQLTPVIVIGQAVALAVMFRQRHAWLPIAFIALEAGWLVQAWGYVSRHFNLLQVDGVENLRPPADGPASTLAWAKELTWASPAMMMLLFVLTAIALLLLGRRAVTSPADRWVIAPALFGLVPVSVVLVQPYGNEGIFRAFLFALPWAALLVVPVVLLRDGRRPPRLGAGGVRLVLPVLLAALWLPASFAPELDSYVYPSDVRTAMWTATGTPSRSALMRVAGGSPIPMSADYAHRKFEWETLNTPVTDWPGFTDTVSGGAASMAGYVGQAASWYPVDDVYLVLGPGQAAHVRYHGDLGSASWADLVAAIAAEGSFELIHTDGDSSVWRYRGTTQSATS